MVIEDDKDRLSHHVLIFGLAISTASTAGHLNMRRCFHCPTRRSLYNANLNLSATRIVNRQYHFEHHAGDGRSIAGHTDDQHAIAPFNLIRSFKNGLNNFAKRRRITKQARRSGTHHQGFVDSHRLRLYTVCCMACRTA